MTDKINTSPEAVERLADSYVLPGMPVDCRPVVTAATLRALSARLAEVEAGNRGLVRLNEATEARAEAAEAQLAKAVEVLGFYSDAALYQPDKRWANQPWPIFDDNGDKARATLAAIKEVKP